MFILSIFSITIILTCLYLSVEFSYLIALLCSLAAATFIYTGMELTAILFVIGVFTLTPLVTLRYKTILQNKDLILKEQQRVSKDALEKMRKEHTLIDQSNQQLRMEISKIEELYKVTKEMAQGLEFEQIFAVLGKNFIKRFQFKQCRMILLDEQTESLAIKLVLKLTHGQTQAEAVSKDAQDELYLEQGLQTQKTIYVEEQSLALAPLLVDNRFLGVLSVEGLPAEAFDHFSILFNQFCLEFRRVKLYQKVQELATTDGLTNLFTRRHFLERLTEELERSSRHSLSLSFLMIDIDHFKQCNDTFGHLTGDVVLKEVAAKIKSSVREIDLVGRFGGEEFSVLLPDTDKPGAKYVAERIRASIAEHQFSVYDEQIKTAVSIGVASFPGNATQLQRLIDLADQALYRAKEEGRNRVCLA
ncbi:GGDEF domain-containing protein [Candidatus Omnitrophota bacterium]